MKSTLIKVCASMLAIMMCAASFVACGNSGDGEDTTTTTPAATTTTTAPADTTTTEGTTTTEKTTTTKATTTTTTEPPVVVDVPAEGLIVYYEDFDSYANNTDTEAVLKAIGWTKLTKEANGVYNETDGKFAIEDGRLYFDNYDTAEEEEALKAAGYTGIRGKDGYYQIDLLTDEYMMPVVMGKYTLQYDLEHVAVGAHDRYAVIITECSSDGQAYNSFHFRDNSLGNHQCHYYNSWKTYSAYDAARDLNPGADKADKSTGTSIHEKLFNQNYAEVAKQTNLLGKKITIKLQWDLEIGGHNVYVKTADMADFIQVSEPSANADGPMYVGWEGYAVQFKFGAKIDGYIDNICIWTGWGAQPAGKTVTYKPAA